MTEISNAIVGLPMNVAASRIAFPFGNTSSASVPLTMTVCLRDKLTAGPATVLMSGFGIGLSWGSCIVRTEGIVMPELVEM